ncbi:MAG: histidine kinase [Gammaproteobacteria bacterium]|nr:histidine kinase [Gammaproteobacteria bacterium]
MNASREELARPQRTELLPDLCSTAATLPLVLIAALVAVVLALARSHPAGFWADLGRLALLCEFLTLTSAAALCILRRILPPVHPVLVLALAFAILIAIAWGIAEAAWFLLFSFGEILRAGSGERLLWVGRIVIVAVIVDGLILRYLYVTAEWRERVRREAASRLEALTARIRPHFLFNTLNTAAALAADKPEETERTLEDLSELFRANLAERGPCVRLGEELELVRRYLAIEKRRLGERLQVDWHTTPELDEALLPPLVLQPLLENAVTHGIEPAAGGGKIKVEAGREGKCLLLRVTNSVRDTAGTGGHGIGLAGIRARLALAFGDAAALIVQDATDRYVAEIRCPWQTDPDDDSYSHRR